MDQRYIYYGADLYPKIKGMLPKTPKYQLYKGLTEYLVYFEIPTQAVVQTISLKELFELCQQSPSTDAVLRLEFIKDNLHQGVPRVCGQLGQSPVELND